MIDQIDLAALIDHLKRELDQIEQAIAALERTAAAKKAGARSRARHNFRIHGDKMMWTKHRVLKDQAGPS
jgi:hypothetical protein